MQIQNIFVILKSAILASFATLAIGAQAENQITLGSLTLHHIHATPAPIVGGTGAVFVGRVDNADNQPIQIISAKSNIAERVELHTMHMDNHVMKMREVDSITIPHGQNQTLLAPGQEYHFMLMKLKQALKIGDSFELEIELAGHAPQKITVPVEKRAPSKGEHHHHHH